MSSSSGGEISPCFGPQAWWGSSGRQEQPDFQLPASPSWVISAENETSCKSMSTIWLLSSTLSNVKQDFMCPVTGPQYKTCTNIMEAEKPRNIQNNSSVGERFCSRICSSCPDNWTFVIKSSSFPTDLDCITSDCRVIKKTRKELKFPVSSGVMPLEREKESHYSLDPDHSAFSQFYVF